MANKMFDETRALRREQREARIERKRERREARALKRQHQTVGVETRALERIDVPPSLPEVEEAAPVVETAAPKPVRSPVTRAAETSTSAHPTPVAETATPPDVAVHAEPRDARRAPRRERDIAEFLERRKNKLSRARQEAKERIARLSDEEAVHDALMALAHPQASPWQQHRERLCKAIATHQIPEIGAAARRACRGAAADAARTSRKAPDPELAMTVTVAYAVIAQAPWAAIRGRRAERAAPPAQTYARAFRR